MQQVLMEMIAREERFLDVLVRDGVEIHASAPRRTGRHWQGHRATAATPMSCFRVGRDPEEEKRALGICTRPLGQCVWRQQGYAGGRDRRNSGRAGAPVELHTGQ